MSQSNTAQSVPAQFIILGLLQGQWIATSIHVAARLGLADILNEGAKSVHELADRTQTNQPSLYRLLRALASIDIFVESAPETFAQTELSRALCSEQSLTAYYGARTSAQASLIKAWENLEFSIRTGKASVEHVYGENFWTYLSKNPEEERTFDQGMTGVSSVTDNIQLSQAYDFSSLQSLIDIGGGHGSFLMTILPQYPQLKSALFDRSPVIEGAQKYVPSSLHERLQLIAGDFFTQIPAGFDAYFMKAVLHTWNDEACIKILQNCRRAMHSHSKLIIADRVLTPQGEVEGKLLDLLMLVLFEGRERTADEWEQLLSVGGFKLTKIIPTGALMSIIEGAPV